MELAEFALRMTVALVFGAAIGIERQFHHRLAGLRTNSLVSTGAAAFVALAGMAGGDNSTRIAAQVVSGIGFLGAGVIFKEGFNVRGLNTAATLWCAAAVGTLAGSGFIGAAAVVTALVVATNVILRPLSHLVDRQPSKAETEVFYRVQLVCRAAVEPELRARLLEGAAQDGVMVRAVHTEQIVEAKTARLEATLVVHGRTHDVVEQIIGRLRGHPDVSTVSWDVTGESHAE